MDNNLHHTFLMFDDVHTWAGLLFNTNRAALADNLPDQQEKKNLLFRLRSFTY